MCVRACVRACVRVRACACVRACVCVCVGKKRVCMLKKKKKKIFKTVLSINFASEQSPFCSLCSFRRSIIRPIVTGQGTLRGEKEGTGEAPRTPPD